MKQLANIGCEYYQNAALLELRLVQLHTQLHHTRTLEIRRRLKHRIGVLHVMINEGRQTGYRLAHYYDQKGV